MSDAVYSTSEAMQALTKILKLQFTAARMPPADEIQTIIKTQHRIDIALPEIEQACWLIHPVRTTDAGVSVMQAFYRAVHNTMPEPDARLTPALTPQRKKTLMDILRHEPVAHQTSKGQPALAVTLGQVAMLFHVGRLGVQQDRMGGIFRHKLPSAPLNDIRLHIKRYYDKPGGYERWDWQDIGRVETLRLRARPA